MFYNVIAILMGMKLLSALISIIRSQILMVSLTHSSVAYISASVELQAVIF